jgi:hypothetical protein
MKRILKVVADVTKSMFSDITYFLTFNARYLAVLIEVACPFGMLFLGQHLALERGYVGVGGEIAIPIIVVLVVYYMKEISNRFNKGTRIPIPHKRFTEVDIESGEVNVRQDRLQELILYLADLEDWLERKGWL